MMSSKYLFVKQGLSSYGEFVDKDEWDENFVSDDDYYISTYIYGEDAKKLYEEKKSLKGFRNVKTDKIWFDLDSEGNLELAREETKELVSRLKKTGIKESSIDIFFSGGKGFGVEVKINKMLNRTQVEHLAINTFGKGLETLDTTLYDENQILRVPNTKHPKTGLYKVQLTAKQLELPIVAIQLYAKTTHDLLLKDVSILKEELLVIPEPTKAKVDLEALNFDISKRPTHWRDYKWALLNAHMVKDNERHQALMVIAATCRGLGYDETLTKAMCLTFDEKFQASTGKGPVEDLESNILPSTFSNEWNGGQYSFKNNKWLQEYCKRVDIRVNAATDELTVEIDDVFELFKDYAKNIDKLTIQTGIPILDKKCRMTIGMVVGIVAAPGVGKTSLSLQFLNSMSKKNEQSIFFSYDMYHSLVLQKLIQKHFKDQPEFIFEKFKSGDVIYEEKIRTKLKEEYKNVELCFDAGQTPDDIEKTIKHTKDKTGKDVRLIVIDYNELVLSDINDPTQSSSYVIQKLRRIASVHNCCVVVLFQPNKMAGGPADELKSYRSAKGSSAIEQAVSIMIGISRPGYDPRSPENDIFMTISCLKNRMGQLFSEDLYWDGLTGTVAELTPAQRSQLKRMRDEKNAIDDSKGDDGW
jgi:hypothetical protein